MCMGDLATLYPDIYRKLCLDIDVMLKLFDSTVAPILSYGSEVWGFSNLDIIERLH